MTDWTASNIPRQDGRSAVVTGAGGIGYETALALAKAGGEVVIASRNPRKGAEAVERIRAIALWAAVRFEELDLASLRSVAAFAERLKGQKDGLDLLVNNAGVMAPPKRHETSDGFELQFGTNHLGHFALTAGLLPLLRKGNRSRVITLSSVAARRGVIDFDDLDARKRYRPFPVYAQSKLACLMFAFEMHRRSRANGWGVASFAAHPGLTRTDLIVNGSGHNSPTAIMSRLMPFLLQPAWQGALPTLYAATAAEAQDGGYYGPDRLAETRGYPTSSKAPQRSLDESVAARLWDVSERLTGAAFPG